jgi:murein DD-endopeptidase MepM/ murein hydrolase activator NlpD
MAGVGALLVATSLPANAFQSAPVEEVATPVVVEKQSMTVQSTAAAETSVNRDSYTVESSRRRRSPRSVRVAAVTGSYSNNPNGTIQWPFPSSHRSRVATAPGVVGSTTASTSSRAAALRSALSPTAWSRSPASTPVVGATTLWSQHNINGQSVESLYAHMQYGSMSVAAGQQVSVGQFLGAVGDTGRAYGEHLHLETKVNGVKVDPYAWLKANAN